MYKYILFDLDGTLLDTFEGVSRSVAHTMEHFGLPIPNETEMRRYLGPPLIESFQKLAGMSEADAQTAVKVFRERYKRLGIYEYGFFEDIKSVLKGFREMGYILAVATSKLETVAKTMLEHAGFTEEFTFIGGSVDTPDRRQKSQVIAYVLEKLGNPDKSEVLMVGDRDNDVLGAKANSIACCGVLCGYGSREELEAAGAEYIVEKAENVKNVLNN